MSKLIIEDVEAFITYLEENIDNIGDAVRQYEKQKEGISIVLNYSPKTHAISGNTKEIKDKLMALNENGKKLVSYNANLSFGPGWVVMDKERLSEITDMFEENGIEFRQVEKDGKSVSRKTVEPKKTATKSVASKKVPPKEESDNDDNDEEEDVDYSSLTLVQLKSLLKDKKLPVSGKKDELVERLTAAEKSKASTKTKTVSKAKTSAKPASKTTKKVATDSIKGVAPPKSKSAAPKKLTAKKNDHGNYEEADTGIIFVELPVGADGKKINVAVGIQNPDSDEMGIESVNPLDSDMITECKDKSWRYLTNDMIKIVKKVDEEMYEKLVELQKRGVGEVSEADE